MADTKIPVFISFDYDHDATLKEFLVGQAKNDDSPFFIEDWSIKDASADRKDKARTRIKRADQVIVICGKHTDTATGVNADFKIARAETTPFFLLAMRSRKQFSIWFQRSRGIISDTAACSWRRRGFEPSPSSTPRWNLRRETAHKW